MNQVDKTPLYTVTLDGVNDDAVTATMIEDWANDVFSNNEYWEYELEFEGDVRVYARLVCDVQDMLDADQELGDAWVKCTDYLYYLDIAEPIEEEEEEDDYLSPEGEAKLKALYKELKETLEAQWVEPNDDSKLVPIQERYWDGYKAVFLELGDAEGFEINNDNGQYWDDYRPVCTVTAPAIVTHYKDGETWREALITKALRDEIYKAMHIHITD